MSPASLVRSQGRWHFASCLIITLQLISRAGAESQDIHAEEFGAGSSANPAALSALSSLCVCAQSHRLSETQTSGQPTRGAVY